MSFLLFKKEFDTGNLSYSDCHKSFSLAGRNNLIYQTWLRKGKPVNTGWTATADDLLLTYAKQNMNDEVNGNKYALVIDFHPKSKERIGLIEIERVHLFTYSTDDYVEWSPMMLEMKIIYYETDIEEMTEELKSSMISKLEIKNECEQIIEFLYLNGDDYSWNWGRNGMTNAVFLHKPARDFFRQFF